MATQSQQQKHSTQVKIGFDDGVEVIGDHATEQYEINTPNNYEIYFPLLKNGGQPFCAREDSQDPSRAIFYLKINNQADIKALNEKVAMARTVHREIEAERQDFHDILSFDMSGGGKTVAFMYRPPEHRFSTGEVVRTGKYFIAQHSGSNDEKVFVRMINTYRFLQGEEFRNREEVIKAKFPEGTDAWNPEQGRPKHYFGWERDGKIEVRPYAPKLYAEPQQPKGVEVPNEQQKAAVLAYVKANGIEWKGKLNQAWMTGDYKGTPKDHQPLLQQVRNQFGPEWLHRATVRSLSPGPVVITAADEAALKRSGQAISSHMEAESRWSDGQRIFAFHEQGGKPVELTSFEQLGKWTPDQLMALPDPQQKQDKPEVAKKPKATHKADPAKPEGSETPAKKPAAKSAKVSKEASGPVASM